MIRPLLQHLKSIGPALIVASVVLGPGSILTASRVGAGHGYAMAWVLIVAAVLMIGSVALAARLGLTLPDSIGSALARTIGRPFAVFVGLTVFVIIAAFQSSNNIAVVTALEPLLGRTLTTTESVVGLIGFNGLLLFFLFGLRKLYTPLEKGMAILVGLMLVAFAANLIARPSPSGLLIGLIPKSPASNTSTFALLGLFATTFSIAGAFYQAYLMREKAGRLPMRGAA